MIEGKKVLLSVSGGIAVYKAAALTSKLVQAGVEVKVMMSQSACEFVTPLTFQSLSRNSVYTDTFDEKDPKKIAHIDLADWADIHVIAPATANTIGKLANGIADDMITTTLLATTAPVMIAPAMNVHMYENKIVQSNMKKLKEVGYHFIEPGEGYLACGYVGKGRLEEPETIVDSIRHFFKLQNEAPFKGKKIVITAGPTVEKLDPVRFFTNRSSGKMGYAIAEVAKLWGGEVTLISGPVHLDKPSGVNVVNVESANEMYENVMKHFNESDIIIKAAAVADYRPANPINHKMKKKSGQLNIEMERTKDILKTIGDKKTHQIIVGFAAETDDVKKHALDKLKRKNLDLIAANNIITKGAGFQGDTNILTLFTQDGLQKELPLLSKREAAFELLNEVKEILKGREK